jgi:2-dehydropantoate 2-reductase
MKIAIIGAGAIGCVVAAFLTKSGEDVLIIGREDQVNVINKEGLRITGVKGEKTFKVKALTVLDQEYDLVIFTVKTQDLERAYQDNVKYLEECFILSSQNGVQADNILGAHFEREKMLSSIVMFGATYNDLGEIVYNFEGDWIVGRPFTPIDPKVHEVVAILSKAFNVIVSENISGMKWLKLFVNFNNCLPALIGQSMQETYSDMDFCRLSIMLLKEGIAIVDRADIELVSLPEFPKDRVDGLVEMPLDQAAGIINQTLPNLSKEPLYGSILQSIKREKPSEIDFINGEVTHLAHQMRIESPLNSKVVDMVHKVEQTKNFFTPDDVKKEFNLN